MLKMNTVDSRYLIKFIEKLKYKQFYLIIMEYVIGCDLMKLLNDKIEKEYDKLNEEEVNLIIRQVVQGCKDLNEKEIIHRDLNIRNVMIHHPELELNDDDLQKMENKWFRKQKRDEVEIISSQRLYEKKFVIKIVDLGYAKN